MPLDNLKETETTKERNLRWQSYISEIARENEGALRELYDESNRLVYSLALRMLNDESEAEEVTLDVFKYVWSNSSGYDTGLSNPATWLVMLTRSRSIDRIRSRKNPSENFDIIENELADPDINPEHSALESQKRKIVLGALSELNPKQRTVVEMAYFYQYSQTEIANKMDIPVGSVKSTIRLAKEKLKKTLSEFE